jgi:hypothetical protein
MYISLLPVQPPRGLFSGRWIGGAGGKPPPLKLWRPMLLPYGFVVMSLTRFHGPPIIVPSSAFTATTFSPPRRITSLAST